MDEARIAAVKAEVERLKKESAKAETKPGA